MQRTVKTALIVSALIFMQIFFMSGPEQAGAYGLGNTTFLHSQTFTENMSTNSGATVTISGTLATPTTVSLSNADPGSSYWDNFGTLIVGGPAALNGGTRSTLTAKYVTNESGATIKGYGKIIGSVTNKNGSTFRVGGSPGTMEIEGSLDLQPSGDTGGNIWFTVAGETPCHSGQDCTSGYSQLEVTNGGNVHFGGTLNIQLSQQYMSVPEDNYNNSLPGPLRLFIIDGTSSDNFSNIRFWNEDGTQEITAPSNFAGFDPSTGDIVTTPLPPAVLLLGSGLLALGIIRRKHKE